MLSFKTRHLLGETQMELRRATVHHLTRSMSVCLQAYCQCAERHTRSAGTLINQVHLVYFVDAKS